jgi:Cu+-exporting ATPase
MVAALRARRITMVMLTGDGHASATAMAAQVGITDVIADATPASKLTTLQGLQAAGHVVAMVGDGINDAPALAAADVGVAIGTGTDVAIEAADVTLMRADLGTLPKAVALSHRTMRIIHQNLGWALAYNVIGIPVAAGVLYPAFGLQLSPAMAAAAMALSSVSVVTNSLRLARA